MEETTFLLLGSNMGDRKAILHKAIQLIENHCGKVTSRSSLYETAAWGKEDQPSFYNQVIQINTRLEPSTLLKTILNIEETLGRVRHEKWGQRTIDIDILYFGHEVIHKDDLVIPHPELQNRRFTLAPLCEIAKDAIHPMLKQTNKVLLENCPDTLEVKKLS